MGAASIELHVLCPLRSHLGSLSSRTFESLMTVAKVLRWYGNAVRRWSATIFSLRMTAAALSNGCHALIPIVASSVNLRYLLSLGKFWVLYIHPFYAIVFLQRTVSFRDRTRACDWPYRERCVFLRVEQLPKCNKQGKAKSC
tara:strand:- start:263 stop:688 length:426 start_codon:yes stop_codon:yes gene_type:complete